MKCAPILLIGFNRPDFTALQISRLKPLSPDKLYFVVDGPRADKPTEIECCLQVRSCIDNRKHKKSFPMRKHRKGLL